MKKKVWHPKDLQLKKKPFLKSNQRNKIEKIKEKKFLWSVKAKLIFNTNSQYGPEKSSGLGDNIDSLNLLNKVLLNCNSS